ncbi:MAG TPA: hypothetical protein VK463_15150 [Desulfomonilaceae bacterium]|nr:hypothetical protein [Desulfomonilaceae bacterium]
MGKKYGILLSAVIAGMIVLAFADAVYWTRAETEGLLPHRRYFYLFGTAVVIALAIAAAWKGVARLISRAGVAGKNRPNTGAAFSSVDRRQKNRRQ